MDNPLVSILMTAYNREKYIGEAIESVLASTYKDFELIVVDDCSKDRTVTIARMYEASDSRVKVFVNEKNLGDYYNRNRAASYATGKYLKYLDSDDLIYPHGLSVFVNMMELNPTSVLGITSRYPLPLQPFPILLSPKEAYKKHFFELGILDSGPSACIVSRVIFEEFNGFSGKRYIGDSELWLSISAHYPILELPSALIFWRRHEGQEIAAGLHDIRDGYFALELPMLEDKLLSENCPLSKHEVQFILSKRKKASARHLLKHVIRTGEFKTAYKMAKQLKIKIADLF